MAGRFLGSFILAQRMAAGLRRAAAYCAVLVAWHGERVRRAAAYWAVLVAWRGERVRRAASRPAAPRATVSRHAASRRAAAPFGRCLILMVGVTVMASACQTPAPREPSRGHLAGQAPSTGAPEIPPPVGRVPFVPPPVPPRSQETYTVTVNEVPARELLFALARDASVNADVHPLTGGLVTLNAIDQTFDEILGRIAGQLDIRYRRRGGVLVIEPDTPVLRSYRIDYVNVARDMRSSSSTATQVAAGGGDGQASLGNNSSTDIDSLSSNRFWERITVAVRAIVRSAGPRVPVSRGGARPQGAGGAEGARAPGGVEAAGGAGGVEGTRGAGSARGAAGAGLLPGAAGGGQGLDAGSVVIPNPETGILLVRATTRQHREIRAYLDDVLASARRQVLIEATIVEIELSDRYQAGVDWSRLAGNAGASIEQSLLAGNLAAAPFFRLGFRSRDLSLTVRLLKEFGNVQVLSSPKLVVLNNQTAVLKAIRNIVYFEVDVRTASGTEDNPATARIDTDARTAPEGIMLAVTPHVSRDGEIILNVRPTITRVNRFVNDPQPDLANAKVTNPVPELLVREMESILRLDSGQVAVLGGLMQDNHEIDTDGVPVLSELDGIGGVFRFRKDNFVKTELVIFIRPRVIRTPSVGADFQEFRHYLPGSDDAPPPIPSAGRLPPSGMAFVPEDVVQFRPAVPVAGPPGPVSGSLAGTGGAGGDPSGATGVAGSPAAATGAAGDPSGATGSAAGSAGATDTAAGPGGTAGAAGDPSGTTGSAAGLAGAIDTAGGPGGTAGAAGDDSIDAAGATGSPAGGSANAGSRSIHGPGIEIRKRLRADRTGAALARAYEAFHAGDADSAAEVYRSVLDHVPRNRDALLGLAAVAARAERWEEAAARYAGVLALHPADSVARAALIAIGEPDPVRRESRLKTLLSREPRAAYLYFGLGNAYAAQSRWSEARRSYSEASRLDAGNADYTYNLAVSLDRLSQPDSAVALYREALELARRRPARFDAAAVLARIRDVGSP